MARPSKQWNIAPTVKRIAVVQGQNTYNINGVDLGRMKIFYIKPQGIAQDLAKGDYTVDTSNNQQNLIIQNDELLAQIETIQICYILDLTSTQYNVDFNVDINILKDNYNKLVTDTHELWEYIKKKGFVSDQEDFDVILPQLDEGEVWVKTAEGYRGFQIGKLEEEIQKLVKTITDTTTDALQQLEDGKNSALLAIQNKGDFENNRVETQGNTQSNRLNNIDSQVSTKLDMMQRMMAVVVGANRWLDGGNIATRDVNDIERTADGGNIANRVGEPRRIYDGGNIAERIVDVPISIDLGAK